VITVQIPAAIRACSPVVLLLGDGGNARLCYAPGARFVASQVSESPLSAALLVDGDWFPLSDFALIISDPTGAAHLAWWLLYTAPRHTAAEHAERLAAIGAEAADYGAALDCAARGLGAQIGVRGLEILRDYALRVVSHG